MFDLTNTWKQSVLSDTLYTHDDFIIDNPVNKDMWMLNKTNKALFCSRLYDDFICGFIFLKKVSVYAPLQ